MVISGVSIISVNIICWKSCHILYRLFRCFYCHIILKMSTGFPIEFIAKSLSSYLSLIFYMCCFILSPEVIPINNSNFRSNVLFLANVKSTLFFAYLRNVIFACSIFVLVGLDLLTFIGRKWISSVLSWSLFYLVILHILPFSSVFFYCYWWKKVNVVALFPSTIFPSSL